MGALVDGERVFGKTGRNLIMEVICVVLTDETKVEETTQELFIELDKEIEDMETVSCEGACNEVFGVIDWSSFTKRSGAYA